MAAQVIELEKHNTDMNRHQISHETTLDLQGDNAMKCPFCGREVASDVKICYCGKDIEQYNKRRQRPRSVGVPYWSSQSTPQEEVYVESQQISGRTLTANKDLEMKLADEYVAEIDDCLDAGTARLGRITDYAEGVQEAERVLDEYERKISMLARQVLRIKRLFPDDPDVGRYDYIVNYKKGVHSEIGAPFRRSSLGIFGQTERDRLREAVRFYSAALDIRDGVGARSARVDCYVKLGDKTSALKDLEYILEHHADNERAYLEARKKKDELIYG